MATSTRGWMLLQLCIGFLLDDPRDSGEAEYAVINAGAKNRGRRWIQGTSSGQVDTPYVRDRSALGAGATDSYNVLAAGALKTPSGDTVDLDEFKAMIVRVTDGTIKVVGGAANPMSCFTGSGEGVVLVADSDQATFALDLGPDGIDVTANGTFEIIEAGGATTADYEIEFIGAS